MATLERIRRRSGLLIIVIGLAMAAFILTDLLGSGNSIFNDYTTIGKVDGKKIDREEFALKIEELKVSNPQYASFSQKQLADFVWNNVLRDEILGSETEDLGMSITSDELYYDIINNPQIRQAFTNPQTGQFDENRFKQYVSQIRESKDNDQQARDLWNQWIAFEKGVKEQSLTFKYNTAIEKAMYIPKAIAQQNYYASNTNHQMQFIQLPYSSIADSTIEVTESDKSNYYKAHKEDFKQEAVRNIEYINYPITPSEADRQEVVAELNALLEDKIEFNTTLGRNDTIPGFRNTDEDSAFAVSYSDLPVDASYMLEGQVPPNLDSVMFAQEEPGLVVGPYEEANGFKVSKLSDIKYLADSVKARHILIAFAGAERAGENVTRSPQEAKTLADSLFALVKEDKSQFDSVSRKFNDDLVAASKGGDLGYFTQGQMAGPFNNYCFYNKTGDMGLVITNFGFHIIEITDQVGSSKAIRITSIFREVLSSEQTIKDIYNQASSYASEAQRSEDFRALAEEKGLALRPATNIKAFDENIPGLGMSRRIVRWAWDNEREEGEIGLIDNEGNGYVVVILTDKLEEGYTPMDKIDDRLTAEVIKQKKGEQLVAKLKEVSGSSADINAIATAMNVQVTSQSFNRKATSITGSGPEPKIIGMMLGTPQGVVSDPVAGQGAAYVFTTIGVSDAVDKGDYADNIAELRTNLRNRVAGQVFESLKNGVTIDDKRAQYY